MNMKLTWYVFLTILKPLISRNARIAPSSCLQTSSKIHATNLPNLFFYHHYKTAAKIRYGVLPVRTSSCGVRRNSDSSGGVRRRYFPTALKGAVGIEG